MSTARQSSSGVAVVGVGIDTARYGHHATFLLPDLNPATTPLEFSEDRKGYDRFKQRLEQLHQRHPQARLRVRMDVAGQYAANLEGFLRALPLPLEISIGDPVRNQNYRKAHSPKRKADVVDSYAVARYAVVERPEPSAEFPQSMQQLRTIAGRLEATVREQTRHVNPLHGLLTRVFPELALHAGDFKAAWVLELLARHPTPARLAKATADELSKIAHLSADKAATLQAVAKDSIASLLGKPAESLVRQLVRQLRGDRKERQRLEELLGDCYRALPKPNHLDTIVGFGVVTAAILTAKIVDIERFARPENLVSYFGVFPEENSSGAPPPNKKRQTPDGCMSRKGNDLVRSYLFNAARSASAFNPATKALYARLRARKTHGRVALGHVMRKLLHLAFAVWKSNKPFDRQHYDWTKTPVEPPIEIAIDKPIEGEQSAAGRSRKQAPDDLAVTATEPST